MWNPSSWMHVCLRITDVGTYIHTYIRPYPVPRMMGDHDDSMMMVMAMMMMMTVMIMCGESYGRKRKRSSSFPCLLLFPPSTGCPGGQQPIIPAGREPSLKPYQRESFLPRSRSSIIDQSSHPTARPVSPSAPPFPRTVGAAVLVIASLGSRTTRENYLHA